MLNAKVPPGTGEWSRVSFSVNSGETTWQQSVAAFDCATRVTRAVPYILPLHMLPGQRHKLNVPTLQYIMGSSLRSVCKDVGLGLTTHVQEISVESQREIHSHSQVIGLVAPWVVKINNLNFLGQIGHSG